MKEKETDSFTVTAPNLSLLDIESWFLAVQFHRQHVCKSSTPRHLP